MDQVTQQNAALVEEAAAAAASLQEQAGSLVEAVSVFRLDAGAQAIRIDPCTKPAARDGWLASPAAAPGHRRQCAQGPRAQRRRRVDRV